MLARSWVGRGGPESSHALGSNRQGCKPHGHAPGHMRKSSEQHAPTQALPAQLPRPQPPGEPVARTGLWSVVCSLPAGSRRSNPQENMVADEGCECQDPSHTQVPPAPPLTQAGQSAGPQEPGLHGDAVGRGGGQCVCVCAVPFPCLPGPFWTIPQPFSFPSPHSRQASRPLLQSPDGSCFLAQNTVPQTSTWSSGASLRSCVPSSGSPTTQSVCSLSAAPGFRCDPCHHLTWYTSTHGSARQHWGGQSP